MQSNKWKYKCSILKWLDNILSIRFDDKKYKEIK